MVEDDENRFVEQTDEEYWNNVYKRLAEEYRELLRAEQTEDVRERMRELVERMRSISIMDD